MPQMQKQECFSSKKSCVTVLQKKRQWEKSRVKATCDQLVQQLNTDFCEVRVTGPMSI